MFTNCLVCSILRELITYDTEYSIRANEHEYNIEKSPVPSSLASSSKTVQPLENKRAINMVTILHEADNFQGKIQDLLPFDQLVTETGDDK